MSKLPPKTAAYIRQIEAQSHRWKLKYKSERTSLLSELRAERKRTESAAMLLEKALQILGQKKGPG